MADVVGLQLAGRELPNLNELVPATGNNDRVLRVGAEADARNPLSVALLGDGVLAVAEGVPELDGTIAGAGDDLTVVGRERDGEDIVGVANEAASGGAGGKLPQTKGLVPRGRESISAIRGDNAVRDDVGVAVERPLRVTVLGLVTGEVPNDQSLVSGSREKHVGVLHGSRQAGDPAIVALEGSLEDQLFSHWSGPRVDVESSTCEVGKISDQSRLLVSKTPVKSA